MEVMWSIDETKMAIERGTSCPKAVLANMLNAIAMEEIRTITDYTKTKEMICEVCKDDEKLCSVLCKMMDAIIQDEGDHQASVQKAAMLLQGIKAPSPDEYKKAVRGNDTKTI